MVHHLNKAMCDSQDPFQFAYKQGRSTEDAVITLMHLISKHLDKPNSYGLFYRLFLGFSSAFNTIQPDLLNSKAGHTLYNLSPFLTRLLSRKFRPAQEDKSNFTFSNQR